MAQGGPNNPSTHREVVGDRPASSQWDVVGGEETMHLNRYKRFRLDNIFPPEDS